MLASFPPGIFLNSLELANYDIVFLDYNNGTDDIVRNAALLQEVIAWVNTKKAAAGSGQKNVVMGISMGGLVARYCLANMTKQGIDPQTRLLFTHDSPHQGANVPLGLQSLTRALYETTIVRVATHAFGFIDMIPQLTQAIRVMNAPATQQMLIVQATNGTGGYATNTFLSTTYRNMITFPASGPQPAYKIESTSLGSECGLGSLAPGTNLLHTAGQFFISPAPWISRTSFNTNIVANALPSYGSSQLIMNLHVWINLWILYVIIINVDLTNKSASSPPNMLPWDGAPGGTQNVAQQVGTQIPSNTYSLGPFVNIDLHTTLAGDFCFVPTVSALDITTINATAHASSYVGGISPTDPARVGNFIAQEKYTSNSKSYYNQSHPRFTARNAQWIFNEMENPVGNTVNCSSDCSTSYAGLISGPSPLCGTANYVVNNLPPNSSVSWSSFRKYALTINSSGMATRVNNSSGPEEIIATINGSCGSTSASFSVDVGLPYFTQATCNGLPVNFGGTYANPYYVGAWNSVLVTGSENVNFSLSSPYFTYGSYQGHGVYNFISKYSNNTIHLFITSTNSCGTTNGDIYFCNMDNCTGGMFVLSAYPNPATSTLSVQVTDSLSTNTQHTLDEQCEIRLMDRFSRTVFTAHSSDRTFDIPTDGLPSDIYYLNVFYKDKVLQKQIVIKK